ncbi:hypothetical protein [Cellulomonas sp. KRMCY2]|uniref:hypothetical protein n=1 Tax=Cellulomonas sp. KRMCY2 TaxID=1304865 RepID=UPI00045E9787|nr:hypothetical protein [Cellulomonas sp. KRMCY2]
MAGTEQDSRHPRRRFVTRHEVEDAAAAGQPVRLHGRDVITHEAAQRARDLGVVIEREPSGGAPGPSAGRSSASRSAPSVATSAAPDDLRRAVRAAVVAELGVEPPGLDAVIARVLDRRER